MRFRRGIPINALLCARVLAQRDGRATLQQYFDSGYYCNQYRDVRESSWPSLLHYVLFGYTEYRDPSAQFSTAYYLRKNPDVLGAAICPLLHYALCGRRERRQIAPASGILPEESSHVDSAPSETANFIEAWPLDQPIVTVVIPCFNYGHFLREALESVMRQTLQSLEVIVVEGGSTDPISRATIRDMAEEQWPKTRFLYRDSRALPGDNRNFGITEARGKYVCCLDADDRLHPAYLEVATYCAEAGGFDIVSPSVRCFGESNLEWSCSAVSLQEIAEENRVATAALFRRSVWQAIGGFRDWGLGDTHIPEDWDFWVRALGAGFTQTAFPAPMLDYRVHKSNLTRSSNPSKYKEGIRRGNLALLSNPQPGRVAVPPANPLVNLEREGRGQSKGILLCLPWITKGGAEKLMKEISSRMIGEGTPVAVMTTAHYWPGMSDDSSSFEQAGVPVYALPEMLPDRRLWPGFVEHLIHKYAVGTLIVCGSEYTYRLLADLRAKFPSLLVVDQLFNEEGHIESNRRFSSDLDLTLVPSERVKKTLIDKYGETSERIALIRHGLLPKPATSPSMLLQWEGRFVLSFIGRLSTEKAPLAFVDLAATLSCNEKFVFLLVGDGPLGTVVHKRIRDRGVESKFLTPGLVEDALPYVRVSNVIVVPSIVDGMPNVILEAMSEGIPVVASAVGGIPEMVREGETGFLCQPLDLAAFAARIVQLAEDSALCRSMGDAARELVQDRFSFEETISGYKRIVRRGRTD